MATQLIVGSNPVRHGRIAMANGAKASTTSDREDGVVKYASSGAQGSSATPNPTTIGTKYDTRFDDPTYYTN